MHEDGPSFFHWVRIHKKQLLYVGVSVIVLGGGFFLVKNTKKGSGIPWKSIPAALLRGDKISGELIDNLSYESFCDNNQNILSSSTSGCLGEPWRVKGHIRNLPAGQQASIRQIEIAAASNIILLPGQTWIQEYEKNWVA